MSKLPTPYPGWVCGPCGREAAGPRDGQGRQWSTWHEDTCDVCLETRACTEPRDFGYPAFVLSKEAYTRLRERQIRQAEERKRVNPEADTDTVRLTKPA